MERLKTRTWALGLVAACVVTASVAIAQPTLPYENHYNVYKTPPIPYAVPAPITLTDQFGTVSVTSFLLERFANPAEKRIPETGEVFPIINPVIHQTWWRIDAPQPPRTIVGIDQFGTSQWHLGDAVYLLNPALKNVQPPATPPVWNHYLCYNAQGPTLARPVVLIDQFGQYQVQVLYGKLFCNPVEKRDVTGIVYPIIDPIAHLACYLIQSPTPFGHAVVAIDQFGNWQFDTLENDCMCVPALKEHVLKTEQSTWGKVKALYN